MLLRLLLLLLLRLLLLPLRLLLLLLVQWFVTELDQLRTPLCAIL